VITRTVETTITTSARVRMRALLCAEPEPC
jgi:hypothetical protein